MICFFLLAAFGGGVAARKKSDAQIVAAFNADGFNVTEIKHLPSGARAFKARSLNATGEALNTNKIAFFFYFFYFFISVIKWRA